MEITSNGAGGAEDPILLDKESPTALTSDTSGIKSSEQAGESEGEVKVKTDGGGLDDVNATGTDNDKDIEVHEEITPEYRVNKSCLTPDKKTTTFDGTPRPGSHLQKYFEDSEFSRESSVDIDSLVHAQLDSDTSPSPNEKSWDEELRESLKQDRELHELGISAEGVSEESDKTPSETRNQSDIPTDNYDPNNIENVNATPDDKNNHLVINVQETERDENGNVNTVPELNKDLMMPETREDIDGTVSPSLMFASCRYRWEKAILTQSPTVVFVTINKKEIEPIKLCWSDTSSCYFSDEFKIPVGTYVGNLVIDGNFYPVEDITIKHYTFEVDLYLKDEIIEDEQHKSNGVEPKIDHVVQQNQHQALSKPLSTEDLRTSNLDYTTNRDYKYSSTLSRTHMESDKESIKSEGSGINLSSKYQDLVRSQMSNKNSFLDQDSDMEVGYSVNSELHDMEYGRRSPVGEDGTKQFHDGDDTALIKFGMPYLTGTIDEQTSPKGTNLGRISSVDEDITADLLKRESPDRTITTSVIDDVLGNGHSRTPIYSTETPIHSRNSSAHSSARHTPLSDTHELVRPESVNSCNSANSVSRHLIDDLLHNALGRDKSSPTVEAKHESKEGSINGSLAKTPPPEQIDDVLNPSDRHSPIRREYLNGTQHTSNPSANNSAHSSQRQTPQKEFITNSLHTSQEKLYSPQEIRKISYSNHESPHSSHHSSQKSSHHSASNSSTSSRPQSLTSEQELTQYYENGTETHKVQSSPLQNEGSVQQRTSSASSLPVIGTQRHSPEKRSMTPDNHIRIPGAGSILKGPLLPGRTTPRTPLSNASSRTVTPVNIEGQDRDVKLQEQIRDLENTVTNLRRLLANREQEVVEVKGQFEEVRNLNQKLQGDVDRLQARASPGPQITELDRKYREVLDERDRLSSEIELLREELRSKEQPSLNSYDPNSPAALQRKIDDLTSQIQDLQEAHETTVAELSAAENKVKQLAEDNEQLRIDKTSAMRDVEDNNRLLKSEVARLKENRATFTEATEHRLKIELQQVRDDNRNLRERNYQLHDDNIKIKEELMNLRKSFELMDNTSKTYREEKKSPKTVEDYIREDRTKHLESGYHGDRESRSHRKSDPFTTYQRTDLLDDTERDYNSYAKTSKDLYDSQTESLKADRLSYDLNHDVGRRSTTDHLARSDGGRYHKSGSYGNLETDRLAQSESLRYTADYRSMPDGGTADRLRPSPPKYEPQSRTPERLSAMNLPKTDIRSNSPLDRTKYERLDRSEVDYVRKDRSRTSSAEIEFRTMPVYSSDARTKTMPILSGRSKEIYAEITDKRLKERNQSVGADVSKPIKPCESDDNKDEANKTDQSPSNTPTTSAQVFVNRYIPQNSKEPNQPSEASADESKLLNLDHVDVTYTRTTSTLPSHSRLTDREEKDYNVRGGIYQDDGDMSDTATDILVNAQPIDKMPNTWNKTRVRRGSLGSDGSDYSDIDEQLRSVIRKRSKSADGREVLRRMAPTGSSSTRAGGTTPGKGDRPLSRAMSPGPGNTGFRSITPRPMATQHNKTTLSIASSMNTLTQGLRPFAPRSPQDLQVNDVIKFSRQGGKLSQGTIKFIGHLPGRGDIYLGVELDKEEGKHDGVFEGIRYFKWSHYAPATATPYHNPRVSVRLVKPSKGVFVAYNKVVMAWTTY